MNKNDKETLEELEAWKHQLEMEKAVKAAISETNRTWLKWGITVCITVTSGIVAAFHQLGSFLYTYWEPLKLAIKAFLEAGGGKQ